MLVLLLRVLLLRSLAARVDPGPLLASLAMLALAAPWGAGASEVLRGPLHARAVDFGPESIAFPVWGESEPVGRFSVVVEGEPWLSPQTLRIRTDTGGWLLGITADLPRRLWSPRRDFSGYALRNGAPYGALCPTGVESFCWREGDPPLPLDDVVAALCAALDFAIDECPFWQQRLRVPFRGRLFWSYEALFGGQAAPSYGLLVWQFVGFPEGEPIPEEPEPPNACAPFYDADVDQIFLQLACLSEADPLGPPLPLDAFDPADPFSAAAGQCSIAQPQFCHLVIAFMQDVWSSERTLIEGYGIVPMGQWLWESGTEYAIVEATGEFASYGGGKVFALGPEGARISEAGLDEVVPTPPAGFSLLVAGPGPDPETALFFAAIPEPDSTALAAAAATTLGALARRRRESFSAAC